MRDITSNYDKIIGRHLKKKKAMKSEGKLKAEIEYFAVNLKSTLTSNPKFFANLVQQTSDRDVTCLEIFSLQTVIDYKWVNYTKGFFIKRFFVHLFFIFWLLLDLVFCNYISSDIET